jgi:glycosyltransferase involved in cell wall biosynthesis
MTFCASGLGKEERDVRVAYYYGEAERLPPGDPRTNPYGPLLCAALERRGVAVEYAVDFDEGYLRRNRGRVDVLHFNWPHYDYYHDDAAVMERQMGAFVRHVELARELGYKVVWTAHNLYPHNPTHREIDHQCRLEICRLATAIIAHCDVAADALRRTFGRTRNLFVVPHGHFIGVYPDWVTREEARAMLGVSADAFAYGFFGSIQPYKGIESLIDAFRRLPGGEDWLVMSGSGQADYLAAIARQVAGHPRIVLRTYPRAPSEDIGLIMRAADVVVLPFVATLTSGTLVLALSWGRPVVAPAIGCLPATVDPSAGLLYDSKPEDALYRAMNAIRGYDLAAASSAALACACRFDWDAIAERTLEAYRA